MVLLCVQTEKLAYRGHRVGEDVVPQRPVARNLTAKVGMVRVPVVYMVAVVAGDDAEAFVQLAEMWLAPARRVPALALGQFEGASREGQCGVLGLVHDGRWSRLRLGELVELARRQRLVHTPLRGLRTAEVRVSEEKGPDVNLASHLLLDAFRSAFDVPARWLDAVSLS
jgi:hypothetical protein